jgi:hypothetical protein
MKNDKPSSRDERLAEALRANLRRRKMPKKVDSNADTNQSGVVSEPISQSGA